MKEIKRFQINVQVADIIQDMLPSNWYLEITCQQQQEEQTKNLRNKSQIKNEQQQDNLLIKDEKQSQKICNFLVPLINKVINNSSFEYMFNPINQNSKYFQQYYKIIETPIFLYEIMMKVQKQLYTQYVQFIDDLKLVLQNSKQIYLKEKQQELIDFKELIQKFENEIQKKETQIKTTNQRKGIQQIENQFSIEQQKKKIFQFFELLQPKDKQFLIQKYNIEIQAQEQIFLMNLGKLKQFYQSIIQYLKQPKYNLKVTQKGKGRPKKNQIIKHQITKINSNQHENQIIKAKKNASSTSISDQNQINNINLFQNLLYNQQQQQYQMMMQNFNQNIMQNQIQNNQNNQSLINNNYINNNNNLFQQQNMLYYQYYQQYNPNNYYMNYN